MIGQPVSSDETPVLPAVRARPPARDPLGLWRPGHSGNPGGRPKSYKELIAAARAAAPDAFARVVELMNDEDTRVAHLSAIHVLERAYGKPKDYDPNEEKAPAIDLLRMSPEDRQKLRELLKKYEKPAAIGAADTVSVNDPQKS
jgi:hypothetical protein